MKNAVSYKKLVLCFIYFIKIKPNSKIFSIFLKIKTVGTCNVYAKYFILFFKWPSSQYIKKYFLSILKSDLVWDLVILRSHLRLHNPSAL